MIKKIERIVEYQDKQRTPEELVEFLRERVASGKIGKMFVFCVDVEDEHINWTPASVKRDYTNSKILWDLEQFKLHLICDD